MRIDSKDESRIPEVVAEGMLLMIGYFTAISELSFWQNTLVYGVLGGYYLLIRGLPYPKKLKFLKYTLLTMISVAFGILQFCLVFTIWTWIQGSFDYLTMSLVIGTAHGLVIGISATVCRWMKERAVIQRTLSTLKIHISPRSERFITQYGVAAVLWVLFIMIAFLLTFLFQYFHLSRVLWYMDEFTGPMIILGALPSFLISIASMLSSSILLILLFFIGLISPVCEALLLLKMGQKALHL